MQVSLDFPKPGQALRAGAPGPHPGLDPRRVRQVLVDALDGVSHGAAGGEDASAAARRLVSRDGGDLSAFAARVIASLDGAAAPRPGAAVLYGCAEAAAADHRLGEAGIGLAALLEPPAVRVYGLVGLAVCAARLGRFDDALALAVESFGPEVGHPRSYCIAGLCEMKRGHRRAAQTYLSGASRIARRDPDHADDLRLAQRLLLLMHLSAEAELAGLVDVN